MASPNPSSAPSSTTPPPSSSSPSSASSIPSISLNTFKLEATQYSGSEALGSERKQAQSTSAAVPIMLVHNGKKLVFARAQLARMDLKEVIILLESWCHYLDSPGKCTKGLHLHVILPAEKKAGGSKEEGECSAMLTNNESWKEVVGQVKTVYFASAKLEPGSDLGRDIGSPPKRPLFEVLTLVLLFMIVYLLLNVPYTLLEFDD
ncbi:hypothetical protein MD484_g509, partial [Candolleomyces efflorescens]